MINVLVAPTDKWACNLYRCSGPHKKLEELFPDQFNIDIKYDIDWSEIMSDNKYDIIYLHIGFYNDVVKLINHIDKLKKKSIIIVDIDDYWILPTGHEAKESLERCGYEKLNLSLLSIADYVVTTTNHFATLLKNYTKNIKVFPNGITPSTDYCYKQPSSRIRFGLVGSRSHHHDYLQLKDVIKKLDFDKIQIVLCGFSGKWTTKRIDDKLKRVYIYDEDNQWYTYEKLLTDNYNILEENYKNYLLKFKEEVITDEMPYIRLYERNIDYYITFYKYIDVLLAPLLECEFNNCKSELKFLEAGLTKTAIIASNTGPYKMGTSILNSDGTINPEGNCILTEENPDSWIKAINTFKDNPELAKLSADNLQRFIFNNYNINRFTIDRANWYKEINYDRK